MSEEQMEHPYAGSRYKKPLLEKPPLLPVKKPLLHRPGEVSHPKKFPLLGVTPDRPLLKAPWSGTKRGYGTEELPNSTALNTNASYTSYTTASKRQALLPTPGEWGGSHPNKPEIEQQLPVSTGLLPRPFRGMSASQPGLLPPPTCSSPRNMYTPPPAPPPPLPPAECSKPPLLSNVMCPNLALSPSPGLLPLPGSRANNEPARNIEKRNLAFKKTPLLQTPLEQGILFSNNKKTHLLPHMPTMSQEQCGKAPLLKAPPPAISAGRLKHNSGASSMTGGQSRQAREPLISTPPVLASRPESVTQTYKKMSVSAPYHHTANNSASIKRPLLPTPSLLC